MDKNDRYNREIILNSAFLTIVATVVFMIGYIAPKEYLSWFFYIVIIFYVSFKFPKKFLAIFGYSFVVLTAVGFFLSPEKGYTQVAVANRIIGILLIWMITSILYKQSKERELKEEIEKQFSSFLNRISTKGIIYFDTDGNIKVANTKFASILGYRVDDLINKNLLQFTHPDYKRDFLLFKEKLCLNLQKSVFLEEKLIKKNNEAVSVAVELKITSNISNDSRYLVAYYNLIEREEEIADFILEDKILIKEIAR